MTSSVSTIKASDTDRKRYAKLIWVLALVAAGIGAYQARDQLRAVVDRGNEAITPTKLHIGESYVATRGDLTITVREKGTIQTVKSIRITSEVEGQNRIIKIVPEGIQVQKGDPLVELDSSNLVDKLRQQEITLEGSRASLTEAQESLAIQENQNQSDKDAGELEIEFTQIDIKKYIEGDWPQEQRDAQSDITIAEEESKRAKNRLKWTQKLEDEGFVTRTELEADELSVKKAELAVARAREKLRILEKFSNPKKLRELNAKVHEAKQEMVRTIRKGKAKMLQNQATLRAKEATFEIQQQKYDKLKEQVKKCKIFAPAPGLVVYFTERRRWGSNNSAIEEGAMVREKQVLITLPDISAMRVDVKVHESAIERVKVKQKAFITIDAVPGKKFVGHVKRVAPIPDSQSFWLNPDLKVYNTEVLIDSETDELKPGMSSMVEIISKKLKNVITIPIQAVSSYDGQECCYVANGEIIEMRAVLVGDSNEKYVVIQDGMSSGDRVLLYEPDGTTEIRKVGFERIAKLKEVRIQEAKAKKPSVDPAFIEGLPFSQANPGASRRGRGKERERMKNMTPEEREKLRKKMMKGSRPR